MNKQSILNDFDSFANSKKQTATLSKLVLLFALIVVVFAFVWAYIVTDKAMNKIVVVERSGEYLETSAEGKEQLFITLVKSTCGQLAHYANSFDRLNVKQNQARAMFLCNKNDLNLIFNLYNQEKSYHEALELGAVYKCELEKVSEISGNSEPYNVSFSSVLSIYNGEKVTKFRILSQGTLINTTPQYPENTTGFFFNSYKQTITKLNTTDNATREGNQD